MQENQYMARVKGNESQPLEEHIQNVVKLSEKNCQVKDLINLSVLIALMHDIGKYRPEFQDYLQFVQKTGIRYNACHTDHTAAGGKLLEKTGDYLVVQMAAAAVYSSHGLNDMIDFNTGKDISERTESSSIPLSQLFQLISKEEYKKLILKANEDCNHLRTWIDSVVKKNPGCGKNQFYIGMMERLLISSLYDADWKDAKRFDLGKKRLPVRKSRADVWDRKRYTFEEYMRFHKSDLDDIQKAVLNACFVADIHNEKRMLMNVPEAAGKIQGLFRFALSRAVYHGTNHIFYISQNNSDLITAGKMLKKISGSRNIRNYFCDPELKLPEHMAYKMEDWESPIILTSLVKFMDAMYSANKPDIRRMQALCNSVVIVDNARQVPLKCRELFNLAINFLSEFCGCTVILCTNLYSDIQLWKLDENNLMDCKKLVDLEKLNYVPRTSAVQYLDLTEKGPINRESFCNLMISELQGSAMLSVRTRTAARSLYLFLKKKYPLFPVFLISGDMTMEHRLRKIEEMKQYQEKGYEIICITTCPRLFAGIRFRQIITNINGLDKILELEKYCEDNGKIKIVHFGIEKEVVVPYKVTSAIIQLLYEIRNGSIQKLNSPEALVRYEQLLQKEIPSGITSYPVRVMGCDTSMTRLLGSNPDGVDIYRHKHRTPPKTPLIQAFRTAGENFCVIDGQSTLIVPYDDRSRKYLDNFVRGIKEREMLNKLQRYTVQISEDRLRNHPDSYYCYGKIQVLKEERYSQEVGTCL